MLMVYDVSGSMIKKYRFCELGLFCIVDGSLCATPKRRTEQKSHQEEKRYSKKPRLQEGWTESGISQLKMDFGPEVCAWLESAVE